MKRNHNRRKQKEKGSYAAACWPNSVPTSSTLDILIHFYWICSSPSGVCLAGERNKSYVSWAIRLPAGLGSPLPCMIDVPARQRAKHQTTLLVCRFLRSTAISTATANASLPEKYCFSFCVAALTGSLCRLKSCNLFKPDFSPRIVDQTHHIWCYFEKNSRKTITFFWHYSSTNRYFKSSATSVDCEADNFMTILKSLESNLVIIEEKN